MLRIVHFELQATDPERAADFYREIFGWTIQKWSGPEDYWLITTGDDSQPGINGGLMKRRGDINFVNTVDVPDIDEWIQKVTRHGGQIVVPKMAVPGVGWLAYAKDTDGNVFGMMQTEAAAN